MLKKTSLICFTLTFLSFSQAMAANQTDTDKDGIPDNAEKILQTDPQNPDTDGDGISDLKDKQPLIVNGTALSADGSTGFIIDKVLVEDNYDPVKQKDAPDHLEIFLTNKADQDISSFTLVYTITDMKTNDSQSYRLPLDNFTLKRAETTSIHIDTESGLNHFRANPNSLYYLSQNKRRVDVLVAADGYALQEKSVNKDEGGAETAD